MRLIIIVLMTVLIACTQLPTGIEPVEQFDVERYVGKWYEIARYDHSFERNMQNVTAEYKLKNDGGVRVINRGYNTVLEKWSEAEGKAYFVNNTDVGHLKVSFFGPFYGSYVIFYLDDEYKYSLVTSYDRSYLWILAREPTFDEDIKNNLLERI